MNSKNIYEEKWDSQKNSFCNNNKYCYSGINVFWEEESIKHNKCITQTVIIYVHIMLHNLFFSVA